MRLAIAVLLCAGSAFAGTLQIVPNTTLAAETGNNTSAANTFTAQTNGNLGAGNISKVPTSTLLYAGASTPIYAHFMGWFGQSSHMQVGYTSSDPVQVHNQVSDALSRGISGFIEDWYGPNNSMPNNTLLALKAEAETRGGAFTFAAMYDGGALTSCHNTTGCDMSQQAINDLTYAYNTFEQSAAYMRVNGRPVVFLFTPDRYATLNWSLIASSVPGNPMFIFQNSGGFTHAASSGSFSWVIINTTNPNDWGQSYLDNFYNSALSYPAEQGYAAMYKGFNDTLAAWGKNRIMNQNCGQTWLNTFSEVASFYNTTTQLDAVQLVTWNDYEEGTELETGIDNCVTVSASINGTTLNWSTAGSQNTLDHFTVFISTDGENLMSLGDQPLSTTSLDLTALNLAPTTYTFYVKAVGKPSLANHMSAGVTFSQANRPPIAALIASPTSGLAALTVNASTSASYDPDGSITSTTIDFGDGTVVSGATATHVYSKSGNFTITATVTDDLGATATATTAINVVNQVPHAVLSVTPTSGVAPASVTASTSSSTDPDGTVVSSIINFGDGTIVSGPNATHVYSAAGTYTVAATVYDNLNASSVATSPVTVTAPGVYVTSPTAATGTLTSSVHVVASAASAAGITAMKIYLDNASVYNTSAGAFDTYIAAATGTHSLVVQAWDKTGVVYKNGQYISVVDQPPAAVLSVTPTSGSAPLSVSASTSGSSDPDGSIASSKINFGDGSILIAASATHQYSVPGAYTVTATVTDNVGASSTATRTVTVAGVKVSTPTAGATVGSPVHFVAAAIAVSPIKAMRIYVDNMSRYVTYAASLDAYINVSKGSHYVVVQAWDSTGEVYKTPLTINVQ